MKSSVRVFAGAVLIALISVTTPSIAHHSFAMFDRSRTVMLQGTVKEVQWANPHTWIQLLVSAEDSTSLAEWSIEAGSPNMMVRQGWSSQTLKTGDKISLQAHPMLDGKTPMECATSSSGTRRVTDILVAIRNGGVL